MKILITGGAGFIGSNFVRYMIDKYSDDKIIVLDKLTYAGRIENLQEVKDKIEFIKGDICNKEDVKRVGNCDVIFNFAAETHVDRSIVDADIFVRTDVLGTYNLLEYARKNNVKKYIQISTDEVYGSINKGSFKENDVLDPSSPYSASKSGADLLCNAYFKTYGLPIQITRSSNNYGSYQFPEKLIPVLILNAIMNKSLPIYGEGENIRDWLYVNDNCEAINLVFCKGKNGEIYNIASDREIRNIDIAKFILKELNKSEGSIKYVEDRLGHDFRYSLNCDKIRRMGWCAKTTFEEGLHKTIQWYTKNKWWWKKVWK